MELSTRRRLDVERPQRDAWGWAVFRRGKITWEQVAKV